MPNNEEKSSQIADLSSDLHWALNAVPMESEYFNKLELYAEQLVIKYNWVKMNQYSSHGLLDLLPIESRILTVDNQVAIKHDSGWILLSKEGYVFTHVKTEALGLPAFSLPQPIISQTQDISTNVQVDKEQ